jgi:hypothetical protein
MGAVGVDATAVPLLLTVPDPTTARCGLWRVSTSFWGAWKLGSDWHRAFRLRGYARSHQHGTTHSLRASAAGPLPHRLPYSFGMAASLD